MINEVSEKKKHFKCFQNIFICHLGLQHDFLLDMVLVKLNSKAEVMYAGDSAVSSVGRATQLVEISSYVTGN